VVLREGDALDIDGDGSTSEGVVFQAILDDAFGGSRAYLSDDGLLTMIVSVRGTATGNALVQLRVH